MKWNDLYYGQVEQRKIKEGQDYGDKNWTEKDGHDKAETGKDGTEKLELELIVLSRMTQ